MIKYTNFIGFISLNFVENQEKYSTNSCFNLISENKLILGSQSALYDKQINRIRTKSISIVWFKIFTFRALTGHLR